MYITCTYVCTCSTYMYLQYVRNMYLCMYIQYVHVPMYMYVHIVCMYVYMMYVCVYVCAYAFVHVYVYSSRKSQVK